MTQEIRQFDFNGMNLRAIVRDGEPWFVAKDVAQVLGYERPSNAIKKHCNHAELLKGTDSVQLTSSPRGINIIPESDLYRLIMRSDLHEAEKFQTWVTETVLPAIRKDGGYIKGEEHCESEDELVLRVMMLLQKKVENYRAMLEEGLTVDRYRTFYFKCYWDTAISQMIGKKASFFCKQKGLPIGKEPRRIKDRYGNTHDVYVNTYPKTALDQAASQVLR